MRMPANLTVREYFDYLNPFYGGAWDRQLEGALSRRMRLPEQRRIGDLSHGMRMKFALVCGMAFRPRLMIFDEPLSGVDPLTRDEFTARLAEHAGETTILISSHEIQEIEGLVTHAGLMQTGRMLFEQPMSEIADRFRRISVTLESAATRPGAIPASWVDLSTMGNVLTFVDTQFCGGDLGEHVRSVLAGVRNIDAEPMPLRSIFTSIERHSALAGGQS
jgi:ABC-2 type transport system ATP-binding protein